LDVKAYDHILFVLTLCSVYLAKDWKRVLILVTAFTIGHSLTLALSAYKIIKIAPNIVETLIPLTIIFTAISNIIKSHKSNSFSILLYLMAGFFGLIHGLGFSNYLNALLGSAESIVTPLLGFNLGVEFGQIIIVILGMMFSYIFIDFLKLSHRWWTIFVSIVAIMVSLYLLLK
jgi:hypothetical protein